VTKTSKYVFKIMKIFGVYEEDIAPSVNQDSSVNLEEAIAPYVKVLS